METTYLNPQVMDPYKGSQKAGNYKEIHHALFYKISENEQAYFITIDVSHFKNPQLNIGVFEDKLLMQLEESQASFTIYQERVYESSHTIFFRMIDMPGNVDKEKMQTWFEENVYCILIPKESTDIQHKYFF